MATILDGRKTADAIALKLQKEIYTLGFSPTLAIIQVGDRADSNAYIRQKKYFAEKIGAHVEHILFPETVSKNEIFEKIDELNANRIINGIIVQIPLPKTLDKYEVIARIDPRKDVDGLTLENQGALFQGKPGLIPATPKGVLSLLKKYKVPLKGKRAIVVGRSLLVGKPLSVLLLQEDATVTVAHSKTKDLSKLIREHDIAVIAAGSPEFLGKGAFKKGQVVVDVGTNAVKGRKIIEEITITKNRLVGDVKFKEVSKIVSMISPVPGGVGPMTVASLFENLLKASRNR